MLNHLEKKFKPINRAQSFYCGDAAGRPADVNRKKDFSADDLKFAHNMKVDFHTPESLFLG
jgi:bifunctional polynucleotide phosphatase/kinase